MTLGEYIAKLTDIRRRYGGTLEVVDSYNESVGDPEVIDDDVVVCDKA